MLILALDTTTRAGSAAVLRDGALVAEHVGDPAVTHGQRLPRDLMRVLDAAGVAIADVDLFAVAAGPGSFTGLRVGIATIQGLAFAAERRVVPVSALDALARAARDGQNLVGAWMDAQRGEVFAALYPPDADAPVAPPSNASPEETLERWGPAIGDRRLRLAGDGALRYRDVIARMMPAATVVDPLPPLARFVGAIAADRPERAVMPHAIVPIYVRRPDAELARLKRGGTDERPRG